MENIGQYIKELREKKGWSIDQVVEKTKLKEYYIKDIENNRFDFFDNLGMAKITLNTLIKYLDGDFNLIAPALERVFKTKPAPIPVMLKQHRPQTKIMISSGFFYWSFLVILLIVLTSVVIYFYKDGKLSFKQLKTELFTQTVKKTKQEDDINTNKTQTDSVWEKQKMVLDAKKELTSNLKKNVDHAKVIYDSTDYVGDLLFNQKEGPLNPEIK